MRPLSRGPVCLLLATAVLTAACTSPTTATSATSTTLSYTLDSTSTQVQEVANDTWTSITLHLSLGSTAHDVYLAFTNRGSGSVSQPTVTTSSKAVSANESTESVAATPAAPSILHDLPFSLPQVTRSTSAVSESKSLTVSRSSGTSTTAASSASVVGSTRDFLVWTYSNTYTTTTYRLVSQVSNTAQNRIVNVWVDANLYGTTFSSGSTITTSMTDALAAKFLIAGSTTGSDIYSWDTGVFGREYYDPGSAVSSDLISPTGEINIVLGDLNPNRASQSSFVYGYFWAANNYTSYVYNSVDYSNKSLSFYLDGPLFATVASGETSWSISGSYPSDMVSTLAHEFQHMIHFYQKQLAQGLVETDTWINEMCSMEAEDLVADKMGVPGPRGVALVNGETDYSSGTLANNATTDRLAVFNRYYPYYSLTESTNYTVYDYSLGYSFGSWLARNYGGPNLFRQIVQNGYTDSNAVVNAVNAVNGTSATFSQLLRRWAGAVVASTSGLSEPMNLQAASPSYFPFTQTSAVTGASQTFCLGSIDYNKYYAYGTNKTVAGPIVASNTTYFRNLTTVSGTGLYLLKPLTGATGSQTLSITLPASLDVTVVTKVSS